MTTAKYFIHKKDPDGRSVVGVPLSNSDAHCWLYETDYKRVRDEVGPCPFHTHTVERRQYVRCTPSTALGPVNVARIIIDRRKGSRVSYADGNPLNLRYGNLNVLRGMGGKARRVTRKVETYDHVYLDDMETRHAAMSAA